MTMINNWGVWLDTEVPVPGVISCNKVESCIFDDEICEMCEEWYKEIEEMQDCPECECRLAEEGDNLDIEIGECPECGWNKQRAYEDTYCEDHQKLVGDWIKNEGGEYVPDEENGEFAAVVSSSSFNDITVIWSKHIKKNVVGCSPCAPGCASIDSENGNLMCYELPEEYYYKMEEE